MAAAAFAASTLAKDFVGSRHFSLFERLGDEGVHHVGDALEDLLSVVEAANAGVAFGLILQVFEAVSIDLRDAFTRAVALFKAASKGHQFAVEGHSLFISEEGFSLFTGGVNFWLGSDSVAKFLDLVFNGGQGEGGHRRAGIRRGWAVCQCKMPFWVRSTREKLAFCEIIFK